MISLRLQIHLLCLWALTHCALSAEVKFADIFTDHAVLQQGQKLPVWGTAEASAKVSVRYGDQEQSTTADEKGQWRLSLDPLKASYTPHQLILESGAVTITLEDVVVGEVWICSGQSNMKMGVGAIPSIKKLAQDAPHIRSVDIKNMVSFTEEDSFQGDWKVGIPTSAVATSFAIFLQREADVPIGIIHASWGSSSIEAWLPRDLTSELPHFKTMMEEFDANEEYQSRIKAILNGPRPWSKKDDIFLRQQSVLLYNAMMHPLAPFACRGLVWYQGERNAMSLDPMPTGNWIARNSGMLGYAETIQTMITRYRQEWENPEMHFLTVMLPGYHKPRPTGPQLGANHPDTHSWAWMRESQLKSLELDNTGVATTVDLGDVKDIHPKDKLPIGKRLALLAARDTLGIDLPAEGPSMKSVEKKAETLIVSFEHAGGLKTIDSTPPKGFWLSDESDQWVVAEAEISGETVILRSAEVMDPKYVRYAFTGKPEVNLVNSAELPTRPFRTDSFKPKEAPPEEAKPAPEGEK